MQILYSKSVRDILSKTYESELSIDDNNLIDDIFLFPRFIFGKQNSLVPNTDVDWYKNNKDKLSKDAILDLWFLSTFGSEREYCETALLALESISTMDDLKLHYEKEPILKVSIIEVELKQPLTLSISTKEGKTLDTKKDHKLLCLELAKRNILCDFACFWNYASKATTGQTSFAKLPSEKLNLCDRNYPLTVIYEIPKNGNSLSLPFKITSKIRKEEVISQFYEDSKILERENEDDLEKVKDYPPEYFTSLFRLGVIKDHFLCYLTEMNLYQSQKEEKIK
jgi:hypothetical protein